MKPEPEDEGKLEDTGETGLENGFSYKNSGVKTVTRVLRGGSYLWQGEIFPYLGKGCSGLMSLSQYFGQLLCAFEGWL